METTVGPLKVRLYGTVLVNISVSDTNVAGQDVPLWSFPDSSSITFPDSSTRRNGNIQDLILTARQSVVGLNLNPANPPANGWVPSALVEFDFFGVRPSDTFQPQARVFNQQTHSQCRPTLLDDVDVALKELAHAASLFVRAKK